MNIVAITGTNPNASWFIPSFPQSANKVVNSAKQEDKMMFALMITPLLVLIAVISFAVIADCGLRWWSALGQVRRQLRVLDDRMIMPRVRAYSTPYRGSGAFAPTLGPKQRRVAA